MTLALLVTGKGQSNRQLRPPQSGSPTRCDTLFNDQVMLYAINLIPLRPGVDVREFERFSAQTDRPACLGSEAVRGFEVYRVEGQGDGGASDIHIAEVMALTSWQDWQTALAEDPTLRAASAEFERLVDPAQVTTFLTRNLAP